MVDAGVIAAVERDDRLGDALADQRRVWVRVAHAGSVDHDDVGRARLVSNLLGERLDQAAARWAGSDECFADRWRRGECLCYVECPLLVVALELGALAQGDEREADQCAGEEDRDHADQDPAR